MHCVWLSPQGLEHGLTCDAFCLTLYPNYRPYRGAPAWKLSRGARAGRLRRPISRRMASEHERLHST